MYTIEIYAFDRKVKIHKTKKRDAITTMIEIMSAHLDESHEPMDITIHELRTRAVIAYIRI